MKNNAKITMICDRRTDKPTTTIGLCHTTKGKMSFPGKAIQRTWHLIDASSQTVGRLATTVAPLLKGKHKPTYRPNGDCGDVVVIVNAEKVIDDWMLCQRTILEYTLIHYFSLSQFPIICMDAAGQLLRKKVEG